MARSAVGRRALRKRALARTVHLQYTNAQLPMGEPPVTWGSDGGWQGAYNNAHYLHASISGFNQDYRQLGEMSSIITQFEQLYNNQVSRTKQQIEFLREACQALKPSLNITASQDIMDSEFAKLLYTGDSIFNQLRQRVLEMKQIAPTRIPKNIQYMKQSAEKDQWFTEQCNQLQLKLTEIQNLMKTDPNSAIHAISSLDNFIQHIDQELQQKHPIIYFEPSNPKDKKQNLHAYWGFVWEKIIAAAWTDTIRNTASADNILQAMQKETFQLADLFWKKKVKFTVEGQGYDLPVGITAKFWETNRFEVKTNYGAVKLEDILKDNGIDLNNNPDLDKLAYIYDNYNALTVFSIDGPQTNGETNNQYQHRRNRSLPSRDSIFREVFQKIADYVYLAMLTAVFFGNSEDAGTGTKRGVVFDPNYQQRIIDSLVQGKNKNAGLPVFLFTSQRAFETWKILTGVLNASQNSDRGISDAPSILFNTLFAPVSYNFATDYLRELYDEKVEAIMDGVKNNTDSTLYGILHKSGKVYGITDWHPLQIIMKRARRIRFRFDPLEYA